MRITNHTYADDKITVTAPPTWSIATDSVNGTPRGAILRKGKYILRLCTFCSQASGIVGGRFSEISGLVQPWGRTDWLANPAPCGQLKSIEISPQLSRIDLWFRRDPTHPYDEDADDCAQPKTTATVWYGSYFAENCSFPATGLECGGNFLHFDWLTGTRPIVPTNELVFALTYDVTAPDRLPRKGSPELNRILTEATNIVRSVHFNAR